MGLNYLSTIWEVRKLNDYAETLNSLSREIEIIKSDISSSWNGEEVNLLLASLDKIKLEITSAKNLVYSLSSNISIVANQMNNEE